MIAAIHLSLGQVAAALALVALAAAVSIWQHADLERDIAIATIRSFIQLTAIGYVIKFIFDQNNLAFVFALIAAMVIVGAITARHRARRVPHPFWPLLIALALAGAICARAEAHTIRLALIYALSDGQRTINTEHLQAALALWDYAARSASWTLQDATGDPLAGQIHAQLASHHAGLTRSQISDLLQHNQPATAI
jgi:hypothetical protein